MTNSRINRFSQLVTLMTMIALGMLGISPVNAAPGSGTITGTVTDALTGLNVAGVCVTANNAPGHTGSGLARTSVNGTYTISRLPAGHYEVLFDPECDPTLTSYATVYLSSVVVVAARSTNASIALVLGGNISGTVTDQVTGAMLSGVCLLVRDTSNGGLGSATTATGGSYTIGGLLPGSYVIRADTTCGGSRLSLYAKRAFSTSITVASGQTTAGTNLGLFVGATISGVVTYASTGARAGGFVVAATPENRDFGGNIQTVTKASGRYRLTGLNPGTYTVFTYPACLKKVCVDTQYPRSVVRVPALSSNVKINFRLAQKT